MVGRLLQVVLCTLVSSILSAAPSIPISEYKQRRAALKSAVGDSVIILFGRTERDGGEVRTGFFQEPNFYYLTGWAEPGAILVLTPKSEVLLLPRRDSVQEQWTGPKLAPGDANASAATGFETVMSASEFEANLPRWIQEGAHIHSLFDSPHVDALRKMLPLRDLRNVGMSIARLRMKKSAAEIAMIQHATDVAMEAHRAAWRRIQPGLSEFQVAATMSSVYFDSGCERHAYSPIVGSGGNAAILHYSKNSRRMDAGELLLMDVGPECSMYASDITRTAPVSGKFSSRQRELYDIVLGAQKAAIAAIKPGAMLGSRFNKTGIQKLVMEYFDKHGKDKHGQPLGKYFTHGLGHHVGLDVHDAFDPAMPLEAGNVITIEPGLYIPEEGIGIRIEDMVLVTESGAKVLSEKLPVSAAEIERAFSSR
jgi:Xaa-Pro aminopeptidase